MNASAAHSGTAARAILKIVLVFFAAVTAAELLRVSAIVDFHVPLDPNEGWNAYHAADAMTGRALYPASGSYFVNNYSPLSFYVVGILGRLLRDNIVAGRIVSILSFLFVATAIHQTERLMAASRAAAMLASLFFAAWLLLASDYVGMNDPQLLGHALDLAALWVLLRDPRAALLPALLFTLALFVKHNLVATPLAAAAWLFAYERPRAPGVVGAGMVFALIGLLLFRFISGSDLLSHLASARAYSFDQLRSNFDNWLLWGAIPVAIVSMAAIFHRKDKYVVFCALYAALSIFLGAILSGGAGVDANVFFDADIALSLGAGLALDRFVASTPAWAAVVAGAMLVPLVSGFYLSADGEWRDAGFWLHPMSEERVAARRDIGFLHSHPGRALCETLALCYWADKQEEVDVFNIGQEFATGARSDDDLVRSLDAHEFSAIEFDTLSPFSLTDRVRAALLRSYRIDHVDDGGVFLVPKSKA